MKSSAPPGQLSVGMNCLVSLRRWIVLLLLVALTPIVVHAAEGDGLRAFAPLARGTESRAGVGVSRMDYALDRRVTLQCLAPDGSILKEGDRPSDHQIEDPARKRSTRTKRSGR